MDGMGRQEDFPPPEFWSLTGLIMFASRHTQSRFAQTLTRDEKNGDRIICVHFETRAEVEVSAACSYSNLLTPGSRALSQRMDTRLNDTVTFHRSAFVGESQHPLGPIYLFHPSQK